MKGQYRFRFNYSGATLELVPLYKRVLCRLLGHTKTDCGIHGTWPDRQCRRCAHTDESEALRLAAEDNDRQPGTLLRLH